MLTKADLAKYPFLSEASEYVRELGFSIEELSGPEFSSVLDRAEGRLEEALSTGRVSADITNENAELRWHLPKIVLEHGYVYVTRDEGGRVMEEEVRATIVERSGRTADEVPQHLGFSVGRAKGLGTKCPGVATNYERAKLPLPEAMI